MSDKIIMFAPKIQKIGMRGEEGNSWLKNGMHGKVGGGKEKRISLKCVQLL